MGFWIPRPLPSPEPCCRRDGGPFKRQLYRPPGRERAAPRQHPHWEKTDVCADFSLSLPSGAAVCFPLALPLRTRPSPMKAAGLSR